MEGSNWRPAQGDASMADASSVDWRTQLQPDARQRIVNKIMETLKRHLPISVPEGLNELRKIAIRFEEKIYTAATSQSDYLRKISLKMLSMETKTQPSPPINQTMPSTGAVNQNSADPGSHSMQAQANNPGQQLPVPNRQSLLRQNFQNTSPLQGSSAMAPALPSMPGLTQSNISSVTQASNMQNMSGISQGSLNNAVGQAAQADMYSGAQRQQMHERQQQQILAQQQQQSQQQSQSQLMYQRQQLQHQMLKQNLQHSSLLQQSMGQQQQQQSLLPSNQLQSSQQQIMSALQPNQNIQQTQAANIQMPSQPSLQQNQLNQIQPGQSLMLQNPQSVARQQQAQQTSVQQQSMPMSHQSTMSQQQPLIGQQNNITDIQQQQQQKLPIQQNNLLLPQQQHSLNQQNMNQQQQQQLGSQTSMPGMQQQQQQQQYPQLLGSMPNVSNLQPHQRAMMQKNAAQQHLQQQQTQQSSLAMPQSQGQSQHQASQQQLMSQFQSPPTQMQQQSNSLSREMQQRFQPSSNLLQSQNTMEQKQFIQTQRGLPEGSSSTSMDSTAQTGHAGAIDPQEECFQKIKAMKDLYYGDLNEFHQKIAVKFQQQEAQPPPGKQSDQYEKLKNFKLMLERMLALLQISKNNIPPNMKEKLPFYEKQMMSMVASHRSKKFPQGQQQFQQLNGNSLVTAQQQPSQVSQMQLGDNHVNQVQQMNLQSSGASSMQHVSMPLSTVQQSMPNTLQQNSNMDSVQVSSFGSAQPGNVGSGQQVGLRSLQNSMHTPHQNNLNMLSQSAANNLQPNINSMQPGSSVLQQQQLLKQQQQEQQLKQQLQQRHMQQQQQMIQQQRQQLLQQQQQLQQPLQQHLLQQQKQQQTSQLPVQQLHSINELNDLKVRQGSGVKPGLHDYPAGQRHNFYSQPLKQGELFPVSSPQNLQVSSPQVSHQSSPQIDHSGLLSSVPKVKAPVQSANSPLVVTPSTPFTPSPIPVDSEKPVSTLSSLGNLAPQLTSVPPQPHSLAVNTPGISASPLLAEYTSQDGNQANLPATSRTSATERPVERLIKMVQSLTPKVLSSSIDEIGSVVSMVDRIAGSAPGNGSRAAVGEDLVAMTKCRLQARNFISQDGGATAKKMKRHTSAMPLNNTLSAGSMNDSFKQLHGIETSELESTATSRIKRIKPEVNHALLEEIREINQRLIDTVVDVSDEDADSFAISEGGGEGTVIKCSYTAVALSPDLKAHFAAAQMSPIMPLRLLVPANYPKCSPVVLDKLPVEPGSEPEDLSSKAKSKFNISLRCLSQPMSIGDMARTWDACARRVILEYAQQAGGGSISSRYGSWGNCVTA